MCGVAALLAPVATARRQQVVGEMCQMMAHRGPDGQGLWSTALVADSGVTLGHRRLAILDRSANAAQPMALGAYCISYNGEFYNYLEKRTALAEAGHRFVSQSDTEVLLALLAERGLPAALEEVNGMFAFALWDGARHCLWLARDRFGEKPLYYLVDNPLCLVASEIKAIVHAARQFGLRLGPDRETLSCYLSDSDYEIGDTTFFRAIHRVNPGEIVRIAVARNGSLKVHRERYYEISPERCIPSTGPAADERFRELLSDSLRLRLRSDVTVGASLSGGLDSSSLVCLARQREVLPPTFSVVHEAGDPCDEREYISAVVSHTGVENAQINPIDILSPETFTKFLAQHDEPVGGASVFAQHALYRLIAEHNVHVVLSGQGADEMLTGYSGALPSKSVLLRAWLRRRLPTSVAHAWLNYRWFSGFRRFGYFRLDELGQPPPPPPPLPHLSEFIERSYLHGYLYQLMCGPSLSTILRYEDRNSMAASVEARAPFLDHRVVEHCLGRPDSDLVAPGQTKVLLRRTMGPFLPPLVRDRQDKVGFGAPASRWLLGPLRPFVLDLLDSPTMKQRGLFDIAMLRRDYDSAVSGGPTALDSFALWKALNVEVWLRQFELSL